MGKILKKIIATLTLNSPGRLRRGSFHFIETLQQPDPVLRFLSYFLKAKAQNVQQAYDEAIHVTQVPKEDIVAFLERSIDAYSNLSDHKEFGREVEKLSLLNISLSARGLAGEVSPATLTRLITFPSSPPGAAKMATVTVSVVDTLSTDEALMILRLARTIKVTETADTFIMGENEARSFSSTTPGVYQVSIPLVEKQVLVPLMLSYPTNNPSISAENNFVIPIHPRAQEIEQNSIALVKDLRLSVPNEEMDKLFSTEEGRVAFIQKLKGKGPAVIPSKEDLIQLYSNKFLKKMEESKFSYLISFAQATESYLDGSERAEKALNCITAYLISMFLVDDKAEEILNPKELRKQNKKIMDLLSGANDRELVAIIKREGPEELRYPEYVSTAYVRSMILESREIVPGRREVLTEEIAEQSKVCENYSREFSGASTLEKQAIFEQKCAAERVLLASIAEKEELDNKYKKLTKDLRPFITTYSVQLGNIVKENEIRNLSAFQEGLFRKFEHTRKMTTGDRAMIALAGFFIDAMSFYHYEDRDPLAALVPEFRDACSLAIGFANEVESIGKELKSVGISSLDLNKTVQRLPEGVQTLLKKTCNGVFVLAYEEGLTIKEAIHSMNLKQLNYAQRAYEIGLEFLALPDSELSKQERELVAVHLRWITGNSIWASFTERYGIKSDVYPLDYWEKIAKFESDLVAAAKKRGSERQYAVASPSPLDDSQTTPTVPKLDFKFSALPLPDGFNKAAITAYLQRIQ